MPWPLELNQISTLAFGAVVLCVGYLILRALPLLGRYNIPVPVIGGMLVATAVLASRYWLDGLPVQFDTALQMPLMVAFFTTVGFAASLQLLKKSGPQVAIFLGLAFGAAVLQNVVGAAVAVGCGEHPLFGVLCGSVTLTGGPATGLAFAKDFQEAGVDGAATLAVAAAMVGIVCGGLMGGPISTFLIERCGLPTPRRKPDAGAAARPAPHQLPKGGPTDSAIQSELQVTGVVPQPPTAAQVLEAQLPGPVEQPPPGMDVKTFSLLKGVGIILVAMWAGSWISAGFVEMNITLPAYIGAMLVAAVMRNLDDLTGWLGLSQEALDEIGSVALSFFLVLALMTLELWKLADAVLPLLIVLAAQLALIAVLSVWPLFWLMGRDYDAAVMGGGFCGFMLGTTANSMANMGAIVNRYGPAPRAFLVVPLVGAFFIDFLNALLIVGCLNLLR